MPIVRWLLVLALCIAAIGCDDPPRLDPAPVDLGIWADVELGPVQYGFRSRILEVEDPLRDGRAFMWYVHVDGDTWRPFHLMVVPYD